RPARKLAAPDRRHLGGRLRRDVVEELRQVVDALHRLADGGIEEQEDALQDRRAHAERLGGDDQRFARSVRGDALGQRRRYAQRGGHQTRELGWIALQRGALEPRQHVRRGG